MGTGFALACLVPVYLTMPWEASFEPDQRLLAEASVVHSIVEPLVGLCAPLMPFASYEGCSAARGVHRWEALCNQQPLSALSKPSSGETEVESSVEKEEVDSAGVKRPQRGIQEESSRERQRKRERKCGVRMPSHHRWSRGEECRSSP